MEIQFEVDGTPYIIWGQNKIRLEKDPVVEGDIYKDIAEKELRETPDIVRKSIEELRELLKTETSLEVPVENDDFLMKFLRPCKFYPDSAFKKIKAYYKFRVSHREHSGELLPSRIKGPFEHCVVSIIGPRDRRGRRLVLVECGERWDPRTTSLKELFRAVQLMLESALAEPRTQVTGVVAIMDMKGLSLNNVVQFTPFFAKMVVDWIQDCIPLRLKAVHIVNQPYIFNMLFALFKPFFREKLRSRIHFHGTNMQSLLEHVDENALRERHGGTLPDPEVPGTILWEMLCHYEEDFKPSPQKAPTGNLRQQYYAAAVIHNEKPGDWTYQSVQCGGTVLKPNLVLTVASCILENKINERFWYSVSVGNDNWEKGSFYRVLEYIRHPDYDVTSSSPIENIMVLKTEIMSFNENVSNVNVDYESSGIINLPTRISGWPFVDYSIQDDIRTLEMVTIGKRNCNNLNKPKNMLNVYSYESELCAEGNTTSRYLSRTDIGDGLIRNDTGEIIGILTATIPSPKKDQRTAAKFLRLSFVESWLQEQL